MSWAASFTDHETNRGESVEALLKTKPERGLQYREDIPTPSLQEGHALVRIETAAICGTDVHLYEWDEGARNFPIRFPRIIGHEAAGVIEDIAPGASGFEIGDRVAFETHLPCNHCFACRTGNAHNCEHLALFGIDRDGAFASVASAPHSVLFRLPPKVDFETGALLEPAGVAMHAIQRSGVRPGDTVAVVGCGPIGLMACTLALVAGAARVVAFDIDETRLQAAREFGAVALHPQKDNVVEEVRALTRERGGVDIALEVSGAPAVYGWFLDLVRREGTVVTVGHPGGTVPIDITQNVNKRGLTIRGVFGRRMWSTWSALAGLLDAERIDLGAFITHRFGLREYQDGFRALARGGIKVLLSPQK